MRNNAARHTGLKRLCSFLLVAFHISLLSASSWIDVTSTFVKNPSYDNNNYSYWEGTALSGSNAKNNAEHYWKTYNTYQQLTGLNPGKYRLSLSAFYRMGNSANDYSLYASGDYSDSQIAQLYASTSVEDAETPIACASSAALSESLGGNISTLENGLCIPNNMVAAAAWFDAGYYINSLEFNVGEDGEATIGIYKYDNIYQDWTCLDNWKLEYYEDDDVIRIQELSLAKSTLTMAKGTSYTLKTTISPSDATNQTLKWVSSDASIATVDENGKVYAKSGGKVVITASTTDMSGLSSSCAITVYNRTNTDVQWVNITDDYIVNPYFEGNDLTTGWMGTQFSAANPQQNAEHYNKTYDTYQTITGLLEGQYRLSLSAFYRMGSTSNDYSLYQSGSYSDYQYGQLYATSSEGDFAVAMKPLSSGMTTESLSDGCTWLYDEESGEYMCVPNNMMSASAWFAAGYYQNSVECTVGSDGVLTIGVRKGSKIDQDWTCLDNWKLEYYGPVRLINSITFDETSAQLVPAETLQLSPKVLPFAAIYRKLKWTSSDESVVRVDDNGLVTAVSMGFATITAASTDGSEKSATFDITVVSPEISGESVIINEIMAANVDVYMDPSWNYGSWVELYNPTAATISLGGLYVSDDASNLKKHQLLGDYGVLPAYGYALLNFDHHEVWKPASYRQIDDKLKVDGGTIIISDGTNIIAQQDYPAAISRVSYARTTDGGDVWSTTGEPTPGESNDGSSFATSQLAAPVVDVPAQIFSSSLTVNVSIPEGATLRYTMDGTAPTLTNGEETSTGVFYISSTTCFRFRLFQDGYLPSPVVTRTYINIKDNGQESFPVISIVTDMKNIYNSDYGVFMNSSNGRPGNGQTAGCNWNMDWDRPVNFEYITTDNECVVSQECDFSMCGGWSRAWTPHSFKLKASKTYELKNTFDYQFFDNKSYLKHKVLQIRNGGNDTSCRIKDGALQGIVEESGLYVDLQSWKPVHVYLNGNSYAVLNMREPNNKDFASANYGIDTDMMDQFEMSPDSGYVQMRGTEDSFLRWYELAQNASDADTYAEIGKLVDIDEYINYMAVEFYLGSFDWPQNNIKGFRDQNDGKFHFVLFDLDGSFSSSTPLTAFFNKEYHTFDELHGYDYSRDVSIEGKHNSSEIKFVTIFRNMLQNKDFFKRFIDAYCIVAGSVFTPEFSQKVITERATLLATDHYVAPWGTANQMINNLAGRQSTMINHLQSYFALDNSDYLNATLSSNIDEARILINDQQVPRGEFDGSLFLPITLKAQAPAGYRFAGWADLNGTGYTTLFDFGSEWLYYDAGSLDGTSWNEADYTTADWYAGATPIGYDYNNQHPEIVSTTEGYKPTYYLRKTVSLSSLKASDEIKLDWSADDGFIVYVNGVEAGRYNMSSSSGYNVFASSYAVNNPDAGTMTLPVSLFNEGNNVIAIELHNNATSSSDIYWNAMLRIKQGNSSYDIVSTSPEYTLTDNDQVQLQALWEPLPSEELIAAGATPVKINEVSASNSVYLNEYFKRNDWIELYNTTDEDIDVEGMYLTDNINKPKKYQILPASEVLATYNTVIPAHGYLVVWADQLLPDKQIHTGFKLGNNDDEVVMLTAADESWADTLAYKMHNGTQSVGLYPDGGTQAYVMDKPSIGASNMLTLYAKAFQQYRPEPVPSGIREFTEVSSDGDLHISYVSGSIVLSAASPLAVSVDVYGTAGQRLMQTSAEVSGTTSISTGSLPSGIYIVKAMSSEGHHCQMKFVVK